MEQTTFKPDFYYLCNNCQKLVPTNFSNPLFGVEAVEIKKNNYVFHCDDCINNKRNGS